jgi:hypothetical protein
VLYGSSPSSLSWLAQLISPVVSLAVRRVLRFTANQSLRIARVDQAVSLDPQFSYKNRHLAVKWD